MEFMEVIILSNPKKLNLNYDELYKIVLAINENTLSNKSRSKENKISTGNFLRQKFNINRKDFSFTIKAEKTGIKYNATTFMYDISDTYKSNVKTVEIAEPIKRIEPHEIEDNAGSNCKNNAYAISDNAKIFTEETILNKNDCKNNTLVTDSFKDFEPMLLEMMNLYKQHKAKLILHLNHIELQGDVKTHSIKCYEPIFLEFTNVCDSYHGLNLNIGCI